MFFKSRLDIMTIGLAVLGIINAITIDNHLITIKNDCYERLAIGQRLDPRDLLRTVDTRTVGECKRECSTDGERCMAFSFGIDPKGNSTCELGFNRIQETADLKPIGTKQHEDYDLYIKKTECKLNIPPDPPSSPVLPSNHHVPSQKYPFNNNYTPYHSSHSLSYQGHSNEDIQKPSYVVAILDAHPTKKPGLEKPSPGGPSTGYEVNDPNSEYDKPHDYYLYYKGKPYKGHLDLHLKNQYDKPNPDVFLFHEDKRQEMGGPYQNYYDVPRPIPSPYPDSFNSYPRPMLNYPNDQHYGVPKPIEYNRRKPFADRLYEAKPYVPQPSYNSQPYRPDPNNLDNPNSYANAPQYFPEQNYGSEPNRAPIRPEYNRPYKPYPQDNYPTKPYPQENYPTIDINSRPFIPNRNFTIPYQDKPYGSDPNHIPYRPDYDRPYKPYPSEPYPQIDVNRRPNGYERPYEPDRIDRPYNTDINIRYKPAYDQNNYHRPNYDQNIQNRPNYDQNIQNRPNYDQNIQNRPNYDQNIQNRPNYDQNIQNRPNFDQNLANHQNNYYHHTPRPNYQKKPEPISPADPNFYGTNKRPYPEKQYDTNWDRIGFHNKPEALVDKKPEENLVNATSSNNNSTGGKNSSKIEGNKKQEGMNKTSVQVTAQGGTVTSIITQILDKPCYRRALAGKRIARNYIKRTVPCESAEACQRECQDEKRFVCEGFNYRLDESGRGQGDCELTDLPLVRMDLIRDVIPDRNYDFYEKDRNSGPDCRPLGYHRPEYPPSGPWHPQDGGPYPHRPGDRYPPSGPPSHHPPDYPPYHGDRYHPPPPPGYRPPPYAERRKDYFHRSYPSYSYDYYNPRYSYSYGYHYPIQPEYPYRKPRPYYPRPLLHYPERPYTRYRNRYYYPYNRYHYQDSYYNDRERDRNYWGVNKYGNWGSYGGTYGNFGRPASYYPSSNYYGMYYNSKRYPVEDRSYFHPYRVGIVGGPYDWGRYGGSYGCVTICGPSDSFKYWGFNTQRPVEYQGTRRIYYEPPRPTGGGGLLPYREYGGGHYLPLDEGPFRPNRPPTGPSGPPDFGHGLLPGNTIGYDGIVPPHREDDCSTRRGMGFRLHKTIVKKYFAVPNIHECEKLCYLEKEFTCVSFSFSNVSTPMSLTILDHFTTPTTTDFQWTDKTDETFLFDWTSKEERITHTKRYSISNTPTDNCYLSDRPFKDLDFYTDLEPDRDFDVYTMHKKSQSCLIPLPIEEESECFLRVRSGQRLDHAVVKDSMDVKTIVECQLECLSSKRFTCRSFSYRFGPPMNGGPIDNCQLSDWPYTELNPVKDIIPERGYEVYERGSYGHGCEHDHFMISGHHGIGDGTPVPKHSDKICYVGYAKPARLTPDAAKGALSVSSELDCKAECTRAREHTDFPCMSFSYRMTTSKGEPNCELSDIEQRDLLPDLDYTRDPDSWLFAWDNYSPQCSALIDPHSSGPTGPTGPSGPDDHDHGVGPPGRYDPLDTWRVYSVSGWPCRRGTTCQENREAGFWSCELEGGEVGSWDYCCRPDHRCGYSQGYNYPWCYVGPSRDQWRKCNDRYYPYMHQRFPSGPSGFDRFPSRPGSSRPSWHSERPYRPPWASSSAGLYPRPSLDEYEDKFNQQFLDPPKPGGFGSARHWPVSYLHKEMPPNSTMEDKGKTKDDKEMKKDKKYDKEEMNYKAITSLVDSIKANDLKNTRYQVTNDSNNSDDVLFVRIPMPTQSASLKMETPDDKILKFDVVDMEPNNKQSDKNNNKKSNDFDDLFLISVPKSKSKTNSSSSTRSPKRELQLYPMVRKGHIQRTNRTNRKRKAKQEKEVIRFLN